MTSPYLDQPERTQAQARADQLRAEARREDAKGNYVYADQLRLSAGILESGRGLPWPPSS